MTERALQYEQQLHAILSAQYFVQYTGAYQSECTKIGATIMNDDSVKNLEKLLEIMKPIYLFNMRYQSDKFQILKVGQDFQDHLARFERVYCSGIISKQSRTT